MKTEQHTYENPNVDKIVANVRAGLKSRADLEFCGCPVCRKALKILEQEANMTKISEEIFNKRCAGCPYSFHKPLSSEHFCFAKKCVRVEEEASNQ